ncbi:hypothetical protein NL676_036925 [Syzygium grande]|nr:hypothetical protein NL676_036925 [Syzygium grande]
MRRNDKKTMIGGLSRTDSGRIHWQTVRWDERRKPVARWMSGDQPVDGVWLTNPATSAFVVTMLVGDGEIMLLLGPGQRCGGKSSLCFRQLLAVSGNSQAPNRGVARRWRLRTGLWCDSRLVFVIGPDADELAR